MMNPLEIYLDPEGKKNKKLDAVFFTTNFGRQGMISSIRAKIPICQNFYNQLNCVTRNTP